VAFANLYAPEHLQIATRDPFATLQQVRHAGEVLLGQDTPFSAGNYAIGVPAALPTSGFARVASGITVWSYLKATSVAHLSSEGLAAVRPVIERLGHYEGFPAHVLAVTARGGGE
jgi:histidinol dehydrogenase